MSLPILAFFLVFGLFILCLAIWGDKVSKYITITGYLFLILLIGARFAYYLPFNFTTLAPLFENLLHVGRHSLLFLTWIFFLIRTEVVFCVVGLVALIILFRLRSRYFINRSQGRLTYFSHMILCACFISANCIIDADDRVLIFCLAGWLPAIKGFQPRFSPNNMAIIANVVLILVFSAITGFDLSRSSIFAAAGVISTVLFLVFYRRLVLFDFLTLLLAGLCASQIVATILPGLSRPADRVLIGGGSAYAFCDAGNEVVYATLRNCTGDDSPSCLMGSIGEIHVSPEPRLAQRHHYFSRAFSGEMKHLVCFKDSIQIGMGYTNLNGKALRENVLEISRTDAGLSKINNYSLFGDQIGQALAYDKENDAIFYSSEWSRKLFRYDRKKKANRDIADSSIYHSKEISHWAYGNVYMDGSLVVDDATVDHLQKSIFVGEVMVGSGIYEINLSDNALKKTYHPFNGGNSFVAVDEELQRLYAIGTWGFTAFDTATGEVIKKKRLGFGARIPVIDTRNNLIFIPVTYAGKITVIDRISMETLGHLDIGIGVRGAILKNGFLIASSAKNIYYWPVARIKDRLQRHAG